MWFPLILMSYLWFLTILWFHDSLILMSLWASYLNRDAWLIVVIWSLMILTFLVDSHFPNDSLTILKSPDIHTITDNLHNSDELHDYQRFSWFKMIFYVSLWFSHFLTVITFGDDSHGSWLFLCFLTIPNDSCVSWWFSWRFSHSLKILTLPGDSCIYHWFLHFPVISMFPNDS